MLKRTGSAGGSNMYERRSGELLGQWCGEHVEAAFDKLVQSEMNLKGASYVKRGQGYEFDANAEEIRLEIKERIWKTFMDVFTILERNPEWIYEIESLFDKLYDERAIEEK